MYSIIPEYNSCEVQLLLYTFSCFVTRGTICSVLDLSHMGAKSRSVKRVTYECVRMFSAAPMCQCQVWWRLGNVLPMVQKGVWPRCSGWHGSVSTHNNAPTCRTTTTTRGKLLKSNQVLETSVVDRVTNESSQRFLNHKKGLLLVEIFKNPLRHGRFAQHRFLKPLVDYDLYSLLFTMFRHLLSSSYQALSTRRRPQSSRAFSVILKSSRTFVWSSGSGAAVHCMEPGPGQ